MTIAWVAAAGVIGVLLRYGADLLAIRWDWQPLQSTLLVNLLGCFVAGIVAVLAAEKGLLGAVHSRALMVGFCGGLTTFSTYAFQSALLLERGQITWACTYLFASPLLGLVAVMGGMALTRTLLAGI